VPEALTQISTSYSSALCTQHWDDIIRNDVEGQRFTRKILFPSFWGKIQRMHCRLVPGSLSLPHMRAWVRG